MQFPMKEIDECTMCSATLDAAYCIFLFIPFSALFAFEKIRLAKGMFSCLPLTLAREKKSCCSAVLANETELALVSSVDPSSQL